MAEITEVTKVAEMKFADFYNEKLVAKYDFIRSISMELNKIAGALDKVGLVKEYPCFGEVCDSLKQSDVKHLEAGSVYQRLIKMDATISVQDAEILEELTNNLYENFVAKQELFTKILNTLKNKSMGEAALYDDLMLKIN